MNQSLVSDLANMFNIGEKYNYKEVMDFAKTKVMEEFLTYARGDDTPGVNDNVPFVSQQVSNKGQNPFPQVKVK